ncbi:MAG: hypothetical protein AAFV80_05930 [Bacteroidota bacterium]
MKAYLSKRALFPRFLLQAPHTELNMVVVIPCLAEPKLLQSLAALKACSQPPCAVEVLIVINHSEAADETLKAFNINSYQKANAWCRANSIPKFAFYTILAQNLPKKHAGVGLARKLGMDEACHRISDAGQSDGVIVAFDADATCSSNFLSSIFSAFRQMPKQQAISLSFEHPLSGEAYPEAIYQAIAEYELHLRYFINVQRFIAYPLAYQTIGSSMAVRASAYAAQGGMNRRQAGEDFYFLHKFSRIGKLTDWTDCTVFPSPRRSDRVPFGTGKAVGDLLDQQQHFQTYAPTSFLEWQQIESIIPQWYIGRKNGPVSPELGAFLAQLDLPVKLQELKTHSSDLPSFRKRCYQWLDAFQLMKYLHYRRDQGQHHVPVEQAAIQLLNWTAQPFEGNPKDTKALLRKYRALDRESSWWANDGQIARL